MHANESRIFPYYDFGRRSKNAAFITHCHLVFISWPSNIVLPDRMHVNLHSTINWQSIAERPASHRNSHVL